MYPALPRAGRVFIFVALLATAVLPVTGRAARAEEEKPKPPGTVLRQVVPQPTGKNGYEELILAGEYLQSSPARKLVEQSELPLSQRRRALGDSRVQKALSLLRQGLQKPIFEPRENMNFRTLLPELALFRGLGRLIALSETALLSDGRVGDALQQFRIGLRLGRVIQISTLIHGLVGVAITNLVTSPVAEHLDQLSARDCEELFRICLAELQAPDPILQVMRNEMRASFNAMRDIAEQAKKEGIEKAAGQVGAKPEDLAPFQQQLPRTPEAVDAMIRQAQDRYTAFSEKVLTAMQAPPWERKLPEPPEGDDLGTAWVRLIVPAYQRVAVTYQKDSARLRLLACHAAVLRYRWEHGRPPAGLDVLDLGDLAVDPFTGRPHEYVTAGRTYRLVAAGEEAPNDPRAVNGRIPVNVIPE